MSLIGSLDDLGLGDILQIINLSQKSGVLVVVGDQGEGRIVFRDGLVRAAARKGGPFTLRDLLVAGGVVAADAYPASSANDEHASAAELIELGLVDTEQLSSLTRAAVEDAVIEMFSWCRGEFSFDVRTECEPGDPELLLATGVNAQYLAMEGARQQDEQSAVTGEALDLAAGEAQSRSGEDSTESMAANVVAQLAVASVEEGDWLGEVEVPPDADRRDAGDGELSSDDSASSDAVVQATSACGESRDSDLPPLVVIDPELRVLEWTKRVLKSEFPNVHIFQQSALGLVRVRQYLARAVIPLVLISPETSGEPADGIEDAADFVVRLKRQAPRMTILWLCETESPASSGATDGSVSRPRLELLRDARAAHERDELAEVLRRELREALELAGEGRSEPSAAPAVEPDRAAPGPTDTTEGSNMALAGGEILPRVIEFAAESFSRVAMFMLRDGRAEGMAQSGLSRGGGPGAEAFREVRLAVDECAWFASAVEGRGPVCGPPGEQDDELCKQLCGPDGARPFEAYVAPIESAGQIVALLYADHLPEQREIGDTGALDVVVGDAGLALDRAVLERSLPDARADVPREEKTDSATGSTG